MLRIISFIFFMMVIPKKPFLQELYKIEKGEVGFISDAPLEIIKAKTTQIQGLVDLEKRVFSFKIPVSSFQGFNNPLQREHFNENYLESSRFPYATYTGKIIEEIDAAKEGEYWVRTKGKLNIHGVEQERIVRSQLTLLPHKMMVEAHFSVILAEHGIEIPRVVFQKIAEEIEVRIKVSLVKSEK